VLQFDTWFEEAKAGGHVPAYGMPMTLATCTRDGFPSARVCVVDCCISILDRDNALVTAMLCHLRHRSSCSSRMIRKVSHSSRVTTPKRFAAGPRTCPEFVTLHVTVGQGIELFANPRAALVIFWPDIYTGRQIRVEGIVER
jgi:hypothetical protein